MPAPPPRRPTLQAVARLAEVSHSTVSLILNGRGAELRIPHTTCDRVLEAAKTLGYEANYFARGLRGKATRTIAFLWEVNGPMREDNIIRRVTERALEHGYIANFFAPLCRNNEELLALLEELAHRQIDGVIFRTADAALLENARLAQVLASFSAAVIIGYDRINLAFDLLHHDAGPAFEAIALHLRSGGRRHLGLMQLPPPLQAMAIAVWTDAGGEVALAEPLPSEGPPQDQVRDWIDRAQRTHDLDALICQSDVHALIAINDLRRRGLTVPHDVAVIGFDNSEAAACFSPALATIDRREEIVANLSVELLLSRLKKPTLAPRHESVEMEVLLRESASPPTPLLSVMKTPRSTSGFTLLELLIAIALIAVISLLGFSAFSNTRERSNRMKCINNLRSWGVLINLYSNDNLGYLPMNQTPRDSGGTKLFMEDLAPYGNYRYPLGDTPANRALFKTTIMACPSEVELGRRIPFCYGLNIDLDFKVQGNAARVRRQSLQNAASYVLMSDSYGNSTFYTHTRAKFESYSNCNRRHDGIPNFLYADGHVAPFNEEMKGWGDAGANTEPNRRRWFANGINPTQR